MPDDTVPPVPVWLAHVPTRGGLAIAWVTPRTADGRYLFGAVDADLVRHAILHRWCGVCGKPLADRLVLLMRLSDLGRQCSHEPALHPVCAAYSTTACPMVNGTLTRHRSSPHRLDHTMLPAPDAAARQGSPVEPWFAVWLTSYRVVVDHGAPAASYAGSRPLRIRPITWRLPELL